MCARVRTLVGGPSKQTVSDERWYSSAVNQEAGGHIGRGWS